MFDFTKDEYNYIVDNLMLNEEMSKILEYKIKGYTDIEIAFKLHISERTLARRKAKLKKKIDKVILK